jgi:hypothetical protein
VSRWAINATWDDVPHLTAAQKQAYWDAIPPHQRKARVHGQPVLGSGVIFPVDEDSIAVDAIKVPPHWPRLGALDFGWDHPFAAVEIAHDTETDTVYVTKTYRASQETPIIHVRALRAWGGEWMPWAWPHDGLQHSKDSGEPLAKQYKANGLNMMGSHAQFGDGSTGVEAGLFEMLERMQTNRFKVFRHLNDWFGELRSYHRKDGKVVKLKDDLMSATRYGVMMLRKAECEPRVFRQKAAGRVSDPLSEFR